MTAPQFSYSQQPERALSGMIGDINNATVDSIVLNDAGGTQAGRGMLRLPLGFPTNGTKTGQRVRTAGTRAFAGFVAWNPGKPGDPATMEYTYQEQVPVCVQGRQWLYCENFAVDPIAAADTWFIRNNDSDVPGKFGGTLRYGDGDPSAGPGTERATQLPTGRIRCIEARALSGGAALVYLEFDFRT